MIREYLIRGMNWIGVGALSYKYKYLSLVNLAFFKLHNYHDNLVVISHKTF